MAAIEQLRARLGAGLVIPACPLALNARREIDERRQRGLFRYYIAAGAGGLAVGVHTTQFAIREPKFGLFKPVLELAAAELRSSRPEEAHSVKSEMLQTTADGIKPKDPPTEFPSQEGSRVGSSSPAAGATRPTAATIIGVAGICGKTRQAVAEAALTHELGYHAGLLSLGALPDASTDELLAHCRAVAEVIPLVGFYLQPAAGGRELPFAFWRRFAEIENVVAIKIAPFNRYQTLDLIRAIAEAGREDIALYTGNDDTIVIDLVTPFRFSVGGRTVERRIVGGLLGHWAVWTKRAVELHAECRRVVVTGQPVPVELLQRAVEVTDANAAFFDAAHGYAGCIPGIHEVLRRQGLLEGIWCLDPKETLSPGQREAIDRVHRAYPHLNDDEFVAQHREEWLSGSCLC
jgi:dihydrodipicolinate synthase/N-acetylneuraminate lyase